MTMPATATVTTERYTKIHISVFLVQRCNFNDERLIESKVISVSDIKDKPLLWLDPYLGKFDTGKVKIAITGISDDKFTLLERRGTEAAERTSESIFKSVIISDDYDSSLLIASHIELFTK